METETKFPVERKNGKIFLIKKEMIMLDSDLAPLYGFETKVLLQSLRRNIEHFPDNFKFQLNEKEFKILTSQIVISSL